MSSLNRKSKILIIDDAPESIKILVSSLRGKYKIIVATSAKEGLELLESGSLPELILLDIMMPEIDGYEVCRYLKSKDITRNIPIIFITAKDAEEDQTRGLEMGAVDYIVKPFSLPIVQARIKTHLELKAHRDMLEGLATLDGLTGIPNRRRFDEYFNIRWRQAVRHNQPICLMMIDIDEFKKYNDFYGHLAGDGCLRSIASALTESIKRPLDFVARYGGEEFVVVAPETDMQGGVCLAEQIRENIANLNLPHQESSIGNTVTISVGVSCCLFPSMEKDYVLLVKTADEALYHAKNNGRNQVFFKKMESQYCEILQ